MSSIRKSIYEKKSLLWDISQKIWRNPELGYEEVYAHDLLTATLESLGFVTRKHYLLPTAFRAEFGNSNDGPTIAFICEYDALPKIGHACGHNLIAEIGVAAGLAVKDAMENDPTVCGKVVVLGTPAEEFGGGKIRMIEKGAFRDIDAVMMAHPQVTDRVFPLIMENSKISVKYVATIGSSPWDGPSAVDAVVACYNNITLLRRQLSRKWRVSSIIPNSCWNEAEIVISFRAPTLQEMYLLEEKLSSCIRTAATATDCSYSIDYEEFSRDSYAGMLHNKTVAKMFAKHARALGVTFRDEDNRFCESAVSSDIGNVSHVVPSIQPEYSIGAYPHVNHNPGFAVVAGSPRAQDSTLVIAEALAETAVELLCNPEMVEKAKIEFHNNPARHPKAAKRSLGEI